VTWTKTKNAPAPPPGTQIMAGLRSLATGLIRATGRTQIYDGYYAAPSAP
jgi:hypothetical protein